MRQLKIEESIKNRESVSIEEYLLRETLTTSFEEEYELVRRYKEGDSQALETLSKSFRSWIISTAKQFQNQGLELLNLVEAGEKGFVKGVDSFEKNKGYHFRSWISWSIKQSIQESLNALK